MTKSIRIGTRQSELALWQAHHVRDALVKLHPELNVELVGITTEGDRILDRPLALAGGKGLFLKELEQALYEDRIDLAVHSMKDVTVQLPDGLNIPTVMASADPRDAFVSNDYETLESLPDGAVVGTSSLRRAAQLTALRHDIKIRGLRGNVNTRLAKLDNGEYDAIILAAAGLDRIELSSRIRERLSTDQFLPAVGQGIIGIQCADRATATRALIAPLNDSEATTRLNAERAVNEKLDGGCHMPVAAHAEILTGGELRLRAWISSVDASTVLAEDMLGRASEARKLGAQAGEKLLDRGARKIIDDTPVPTH